MTPIDILVSASVIFGTLYLSKIVRATLTKVVKPGLVLNLLLEAVATFELCAASFETGLFAENHGKMAFAIAMFCIGVWRAYHWNNVATAPYMHMEGWLRGSNTVSMVMMFVTVELLAGSLTYHYYNKPIWSFELSTPHFRKLHSTAQCRTLVKVDYLWGAVVEFICTFVCGMLIRFLFTINSLSKFAPVIKAFIVTSCIMAGFDYTGGHMHPVLASVKQYGCTGITLFQHIFVYWVGACSGGLLAYYVWKHFHPVQDKVKPKTKKQ